MGRSDEQFMHLAIALGRRGLGQVWPNPAVGCVIVRDGVIVGRGWTQPGGRPHAEVVALGQAGEAARGAVAYVSLEPCAHHGHTPPCADTLIDAGVARVVTALTDPDPRVAGRGHAMLRAAGVDVVEGVCAEPARAAQAGFLSRVRRGRPMVTLKLALTLDGRIATRAGESRWITGPQARRRVHMLRAMHDAVLVGAGTARADDPDLRVRDLGVTRQPVRVVLDSRLSLDPYGRLGQSLEAGPVCLLHGPQAGPQGPVWRTKGAELIEVPQGAGGLDVGAALAALGARGITRVLCEGGGALAASLIAAGLADEIVVFSAGHLFGAAGTPGVAELGIRSIGTRPYDPAGVQVVGGDLMHCWRHRDFLAGLM